MASPACKTTSRSHRAPHGSLLEPDGCNEIDLIAELDNGTFLFAECKWRTESVTRLSDLSALQAKAASLPEARWRHKPNYILFALGGFSPELLKLASDPAERLHLVAEPDMIGSGRQDG
jgi:hypothetical protein